MRTKVIAPDTNDRAWDTKVRGSDILFVWRSPRLIAVTAASAAVYAAAYLVFEPFSIKLIPGVLSITVRCIIPMTLGLLFGPAGAWAAGIGNTLGDIFSGAFGPGSAFAFVSNFLLAYLAHRFWRGRASGTDDRDYPVIFSGKQGHIREVCVFGLSAICIGAASAIPLAWGLNLLGFAPLRLAMISLSVNFVICNLASGPLYTLIAPRIARMNMTWDAIVSHQREEAARRFRLGRVAGIILVFAGGVIGCLLAEFVAGTAAIPAVAAPFAAILLGSMLI